ncbi:MAG: iron chelate uptake ABC transporter family permease subunit, partial [bacterium]
MSAGRWIRIILGLVLLVAGVAAVALRLGPTGAPDENILMNIRLPRVVLGLLAGAGLAGAGVIFQ